jgi:hypothetical protein
VPTRELGLRGMKPIQLALKQESEKSANHRIRVKRHEGNQARFETGKQRKMATRELGLRGSKQRDRIRRFETGKPKKSAYQIEKERQSSLRSGFQRLVEEIFVTF